jgi:hypothetical protein
VSADAVRQSIAADRGLAPEAASFLTGSTIAELEGSADRLARLVAERRRDEGPAAPPDPITAALAAKREQKGRLVAM